MTTQPCTERVNIGGVPTNDGRWVGRIRHTCGLSVAAHETVGTGGRTRRVHIDVVTGHRWTTCDGPRHDKGAQCWCARWAA